VILNSSVLNFQQIRLLLQFGANRASVNFVDSSPSFPDQALLSSNSRVYPSDSRVSSEACSSGSVPVSAVSCQNENPEEDAKHQVLHHVFHRPLFHSLVALGFAVARASYSARNSLASGRAKPNSLSEVRCIALPILLHVLAAHRPSRLPSRASVGTFSNLHNTAQVRCILCNYHQFHVCICSFSWLFSLLSSCRAEKPQKSSAVPLAVLSPCVRLIHESSVPSFDVASTVCPAYFSDSKSPLGISHFAQVLLFPSPDAVDAHSMDWSGVSNVVVIDCPWQRTNSLLSLPQVSSLRRVIIPQQRTTFWRYHNKTDACLSTCEAVYHLLRAWGSCCHPQQWYRGQFDSFLFYYAHTFESVQTFYRSHADRAFVRKENYITYVTGANQDSSADTTKRAKLQ
jgi:hypothetical protein